ncbi:hypothetical protein MXD63_43125, partial [Frankia sp. Cpl3]|nr:hypothetical protein [Frankia sp. Cpl3]
LVPQEVLELPIPLLTVQPLVENACNHGVEPAVSGGEIELTARYDTEGILWIEVKDNGIGIVEEVEQEFARWKESREAVPDKLRIGIRNVHSRIIHQFGTQSG